MKQERTAFPHHEVHDSFGEVGLPERHIRASTGMTLREHFASLAMQGMVSSIHDEAGYQRLRALAQQEGMSVGRWIARDSYKQADAMLAAAEQPSELERITAERDELVRAILAWWDAEKFALLPDEPEFVTLAIAADVEL